MGKKRTKILPKLRSGSELKIGLQFSVTISADAAEGLRVVGAEYSLDSGVVSFFDGLE